MNTFIALRFLAPHLRLVATVLRTAGPYLLLELLLPGGTLVALALFLLRRRAAIRASNGE